MFAFEDSNDGFHWDWDEKKLKGLTVGALFRNKEWEYNGQTGWTTECCELIPAQDVRDNSFRMPKDKPLKKQANQTTMLRRILKKSRMMTTYPSSCDVYAF